MDAAARQLEIERRVDRTITVAQMATADPAQVSPMLARVAADDLALALYAEPASVIDGILARLAPDHRGAVERGWTDLGTRAVDSIEVAIAQARVLNGMDRLPCYRINTSRV